MKPVTPTLQKVLEMLYAFELNCEISSFWDGGWKFRLGDPLNGFKAEAVVYDLTEGAQYLLDEAAKHYPQFNQDTYD